ncbi:hypothetical protein [Agromyces mariniharenae]|uniref:Uncharacterized protein n=1 Tax=Agromyces mariniharenae TaxID=2604423 RepID=A0A5S4V2F4_9MICO|nr:hypothetical protein [Agromyces mariniharenae]TYL53314.1 hypothetical protein FYC51_06405 [Agromyces mariniharenae]
MPLAPLLLLYFIVVVGTLIFLIFWTIGRARRHGATAVIKTVGISVGAGLLVALGVSAWVMTSWRTPASVSPEELAGTWTGESRSGTATIVLRTDGSASVDGVPSVAAWSIDWMDDAPDLPASLSGEGTWRPSPFEEVVLTCANGQTLNLQWQTVESPGGSLYLQFIAGDPDSPKYYGEFSRVDPAPTANREPSSKFAC